MPLKGQTRGPNTLRAQYLENGYRYKRLRSKGPPTGNDIMGYQVVTWPMMSRDPKGAVRSAILATAWFLVAYHTISVVISRPRSRDSSALEFIFQRSRSWSRDQGRGRITRVPEGAWPLKDRMAPSKHLVWEGTRGPLKGPPEITRQIQYMIATYQYHSKHRWRCTVPGYMIDKPCSIFD